ncbi:MAG TPA: hypothetical protein DCS76_04135 [Gemmatimonadetes bacterium]|nr:hypothetical protein [Gemmatimonadota bacterium]HAW90152.1 hypothetical protein [Gemmatimonadota bacterium]
MPKNPRRPRDTQSKQAEHDSHPRVISWSWAPALEQSAYASRYSKPYDHFIGSVSQANSLRNRSFTALIHIGFGIF